MRQVFFRAFLLVAYCALVIAATTSRDAPTKSGVLKRKRNAPPTSGHAPSTSEVYKVEVIDLYLKELYKIISFNTKYVSVNDIWNNIYQIPYIAERRSESATNHIYIQLTIITPGQPFIKINNETSAASNTNIDVADIVVFLATEHLSKQTYLHFLSRWQRQESHVIYITKDEVLPKSKTSGKALVPGKKSILLDFIRTDSTTQTPNDIWTVSTWPTSNQNDDVSVWYNVDKIRIKTCDRNGKVTTDKVLEKSKPSNQKLNTENGVIYVDLEHMSQSGSESDVKHIVPLWISLGDEKSYYEGVFRFTENPTKSSLWQKLKSHLSDSLVYTCRTLVKVRIEMIGIENLVITEHDEKDTSSPVNFENAIAVVFTVHSICRCLFCS